MALTLQMLDQWRQWCTTNLHRGVRPDVLAGEMKAKGLSEDEIQKSLGEAYGQTTSPIDHIAIANCAITQRVGKTPGVKKLLTKKAQVFTWDKFLTAEECEKTIALMESQLRPSTVTDDRGDKYVRTSSTCDLGDIQDAFIPALEKKIAEGLGIHWSYAETTQGQKYEVGQEFKSHTDYFEPNTPEYIPNTAELGQRTWTFMIYLNSTPEGGATRFSRLDKLFRPKQGLAVIWNNLTEDGKGNPWTLHHGMKPRRGEKYIITKWFREKGWGPMFLDSEV